MSTASSSTLYPIFTDKRLRAHSPGPVSRRRSPPRRESPPRKRARANSKERSLSPGKKPVKSRIELPLSSRLGIQRIPSPRSQSPRPSTSRDFLDKRDDSWRSRDSSPDQKDDRRKSRIPKRNSSPSSLIINKRIPKEKPEEDSTPEKDSKPEEKSKGEKEKPRLRKHSSSSKDSSPKEERRPEGNREDPSNS